MGWDEWLGNSNQEPEMWVKHIFNRWGWKIDLHKMVRAGNEGCFHTHPAYALRIILWGGYFEELEDSTQVEWWPGRMGIVAPELSHRISALINGPSYSLWIRGQKRAAIKIKGPC